MRLAVETASYADAAEALVAGNQVAALAYTSLTGRLGGLGAMAGDDATSEEFAATYDELAGETVAASGDLVAALASLGDLTSASGANHRRADAGSVYRRSATAYDGSGMPLDEPVEVEDLTPPTSLGGDDEDLPELWNLVVDHLQGYTWPNADTGKLRDAATAWRSMGSSVGGLASPCDSARSMLEWQLSPEIPLARSAIAEVRDQAIGISEQCEEIARACDDYADQVEATRETIKDLLRNLAIEVGATAAISGAASLVTFGGAAAAGAALATSRAIACARKILEVLGALRAIRAIDAMARTLPRLRGIRSALAKYRNVRAAGTASRGVHGQLWSGGKFTGRVRAGHSNAVWHFGKHQDDFPEHASAREYVDAAKRFMSDPPPGTYTRVRERDGAILRYHPDTNTLGIMDGSGTLKTMYKPDPSRHSWLNNWEYFLHG